MDKAELASYLVSLHLLMEGQDRNGLLKSTILAAEYERNWGKLKELIAKENGNETGKR